MIGSESWLLDVVVSVVVVVTTAVLSIVWPAAEAATDGVTTIYFSPTQPKGVARGNWIQTDPKKGWFTLLRLYSPLPSFFDKSWRPSEIEQVEPVK